MRSLQLLKQDKDSEVQIYLHLLSEVTDPIELHRLIASGSLVELMTRMDSEIDRPTAPSGCDLSD